MRIAILTIGLSAFVTFSAAFAQPALIATPLSELPLSPRQKAAEALHNTIGPISFLEVGASAGLDQLSNYPREWGGGAEGFGQRIGSRFGKVAIDNSIQLASDLALGTDPRYDLCTCTSVVGRAGHAIRRVLVARRDRGGEMVNISSLLGVYGAAATSVQWFPDRYHTASHVIGIGTQDLGWGAASNLAKEFWPDVRRKVFHR